MRTLTRQVKGGRGSGFHGHAGRPGEVGGSSHSRNAPTFTNVQQGLVDDFLDAMSFADKTEQIEKYGIYYDTAITILNVMQNWKVAEDLIYRLRVQLGDMAEGFGFDQEGVGALSTARAGDRAAIKIEDEWKSLKGGPGSGFAGHVGRPGLVGGSAPVGTAANIIPRYTEFLVPDDKRKEWADALEDEFGPALEATEIDKYPAVRGSSWLTHDGRLIPVPYHSLAFSKLGFNKDDPDSYNRLTANGFARITFALSTDDKAANLEFEFDIRSITSQVKKTMRDMYWGAKHGPKGERRINLTADYRNKKGKFVTAYDLLNFNRGIFKIDKELKGGRGSGFHGHRGRPGLVGGSAHEGAHFTISNPLLDSLVQRRGAELDYSEVTTSYEKWMTKMLKDAGIPEMHLIGLKFEDEPPPGYSDNPDNGNKWYSEERKMHISGTYRNGDMQLAVPRFSDRHIITHEIGHHVDNLYSISDSFTWKDAYDQFMDLTDDMSWQEILDTTGLRPYSRSGVKEFFADVYMYMADGSMTEKHAKKFEEMLDREGWLQFQILWEEA